MSSKLLHDIAYVVFGTMLLIGFIAVPAMYIIVFSVAR